MGPAFFYTGVANQMGQRDSPLPAPSTPSTRGRPTSGCPRHLGGKPTAAKLTSSKALRLHRLRGSRGLARLHGLHRLRHCKCSERTGKEREQTLDERGQASSLSRGASEVEPWCRHPATKDGVLYIVSVVCICSRLASLPIPSPPPSNPPPLKNKCDVEAPFGPQGIICRATPAATWNLGSRRGETMERTRAKSGMHKRPRIMCTGCSNS